jgi:glycosyltransferase involved in cell wall biosynthesis
VGELQEVLHRRSSSVAVLTSSRGRSLQKVSEHVAEVLNSRGLRARVVYGTLTPQDLLELIEEVDSGLVVMPVDLAFCATYMYYCYRFRASGRRCYYYGTIEGDVRNPGSLSWVRRRVDFIANSRYTKRKLERAGYRVVDVVYHGVPTDYYASAPVYGSLLRKQLGVGSDTFLVGYIASGHLRKGHALAAQVARAVAGRDPSVRFLVITDDTGAQHYEGLDNVVVLERFGSMGEEFVRAFYGALDLYAQFSLSEGFGLPVLEALASGRPVVHPDYEPLSEITSKETSFRVPVRDVVYHTDYTAIRFELHVYDPGEFADVLLQAKDLVTRSRPEELAGLARSRAREFDIYRVYGRLAELLS